MSGRIVEDLLAERGLDLSYETGSAAGVSPEADLKLEAGFVHLKGELTLDGGPRDAMGWATRRWQLRRFI
jgi:hypothetical protein